MVTNAGSGYSTCRGLDVTRWREDRTRDAWGQFFYVRDLRPGARLVGRPPAGLPAGRRLRGRLRRRQGDASAGATAAIETRWRSPSRPSSRAEVRRVTLTNHDDRPASWS